MEPASQTANNTQISFAHLNALASVFMGFVGLTLLIGGSQNKSAPVAAISGLSGVCMMGGAIRRSAKHGLTLNDSWGGLSHVFGNDLAESLTWAVEDSHRVTAQLDPLILSRLPDSLKNLIPPDTDDNSWFNNPNLWVESKYIFGGKGSGKSMLMAYEAYITLKAHPNANLIVLDPHLSDDSEWFGGNAILIKSYCSKLSRSKELINAVTDKIDYFYIEFQDRIEKGDRNRPLLKLMIDEIEAAFKILARVPCGDEDFTTYEEKVHDLIESIQDEGRKFQVEVSLGSHTIKKGRSGVDSDTTQQMHWIACGDILSAPNIKLPSNIQVDKLEASRQRIEDRCVPSKFARTAIVKVNSTARIKNGCIKSVGIPYLKLGDIRFIKEDEHDREQEWITQNSPKIDALWARGYQSLRKLSDELKINRERWQYQALTICVNQLIKESKESKEKTEDGRTI